MAESGVLLSVLKPLFDWLRSLHGKKLDRYDAALKAIYLAISETRFYIASIEAKEPRNRATESRLSKLWADVAVKMRRFNYDLADRSLTKSDYWANPDKWTKKQIREARIGIDRVFDEARQLL